MSGRGRGLRPRKVKLPSSSTTEESSTPIAGCICCQIKELVSVLQKSRKVDVACSVMGLVTAAGQQLKEYPFFFRNMLMNIYRLLEEEQEHQFRVILLHLIEVIASNGEMCPSTLEYYKAKVALPKSCEDAFDAAMKLGDENASNMSNICSSHKEPAIDQMHSPEPVINEPITVTSPVLNNVSDHASPCFDQKEPNNNNVDDDNLADVFEKCMETALSNCFSGNQAISQPLEDLVKAEKEEGPPDATRSQVLPSTTAYELRSSFRGNESGGRLRTGSKEVREDCAIQEEENKRLKEEEKNKQYEVFMKVRGDVIVHLSSDMMDHLKDVHDILTVHFKSSLALPGSVATVPNHFNQKVKAYSREFLLECSSSAQSQRLPCNWSQLSERYPDICLKEGRIFTVDSYCASPRWIVVKSSGNIYKRANSSPYPGGDHANGTSTSEMLATITGNSI